MHIPTESLHPIAQQAMSPAVLTFDNLSSAPPAAPVALRTNDPTAVAQQAELQRIACRSFHVSGARVDVQRVLFGIVTWLAAERCDVVCMSKGGATFESRLAMSHGESVDLKLRVPGEREPLALKGEVRSCKRSRYGGYRISVQFAAYGASSGRNPRSALVALRAIEAKHV
jgi:hypothetical protein